jgi:hypothetical protein
MVARSLPLAHVKTRAVEVGAVSPEVRLTWLYGRLRYTDAAPRPTRLRERVWRWAAQFWYGWLHQPRVSTDSQPVLPDFRGSYSSRAEARSYCRDGNCFVLAIQFGAPPLGDDITRSPTFCRPLHPDYRKQDLQDALIYTQDLEEQLVEAARVNEEILREAHRVIEQARRDLSA